MRSPAVTIALIATAVAAPLNAQRITCKETQTPKQLPAVSALLDSARVIAELAPMDLSGGMLFSLAYLHDDSLPLVRPLYATDSAAVLALIRGARPQKKPAHSWGIRVRVVGGPAPSLRLERAVYCPPAMLEPPAGGTITTDIIRVTGRAMSSPPTPMRVELEALVSTEGRAIRINVLSSSGFREIDDNLTRAWQQGRFRPALLDGLPIEAWYRPEDRSPRL